MRGHDVEVLVGGVECAAESAVRQVEQGESAFTVGVVPRLEHESGRHRAERLEIQWRAFDLRKSIVGTPEDIGIGRVRE
jgi:hypothetical protein